MRKIPAHFLALALVLGCGSAEDLRSGGGKTRQTSSGDASAQTPGRGAEPLASSAMTYDTTADLPSCTPAREGHIAYVATAKELLACTGGAWSEVDLKGEKGDKGDAGDAGAAGPSGAVASGGNPALTLYETYRASIFRVSLSCRLVVNPPATCNGKPPQTGSLGSAFLCGDGVACTNAHVAACGLDPCYRLESISIQAIEGDADSINGDGTPSEPFFTSTSEAAIKRHPTRDLARVTVTGVPAGTKAMLLNTKPYDATVSVLAPVLSMSFPLGFQDLYTDVGAVNAPDLTECDVEGGTSGYGCPARAYDFSTTNNTDHGSSGSPLVDVATGLVIGVTSAGTEDENANFTWAVDANALNF